MRAKKLWSPLAVNLAIMTWTWRRALRRIGAEPDLHKQQEMVRQLAGEMLSAYWHWRVGKKYHSPPR